MITIFTNKSYKKYFNSSNIIMDVNSHFQRRLSTIIKSLNDADRYIINYIDNAEIVYVGNNVFISTPDGVTTLKNLSTGSKACILSNHLQGKLINATLCGNNALQILFELGSKNAILLEHNQFTPRCTDVVFNINNQKQGSLLDVWDTIASRE